MSMEIPRYSFTPSATFISSGPSKPRSWNKPPGRLLCFHSPAPVFTDHGRHFTLRGLGGQCRWERLGRSGRTEWHGERGNRGFGGWFLDSFEADSLESVLCRGLGRKSMGMRKAQDREHGKIIIHILRN